MAEQEKLPPLGPQAPAGGSERVTVLELMGQASASVPDSGAASRGAEAARTQRGGSGSGAESGDASAPEPSGPEDLIDRVERLTADLEVVPDPGRSLAEELVSAVLEVHGEGLQRILAALDRAGEAGEAVKAALVDDGVVASLMLIHDLYPVPLEQRVQEGLDSVRPYMESHGGNVQLLGIEDGVAKLRLEGSCSGCAASSATLELAVKKALQDAAPDLAGMDVEGVEGDGSSAEDSASVPNPRGATHAPPAIGGTPLPLAPQGEDPLAAASVPAPAPGEASGSVPALAGWLDLDGVADLGDGLTTTAGAAGVDVLVANVDGTLLAYLDACPGCGGRLGSAMLEAGVLACPGCDARYDLPRAGRGLGGSGLQLGPVPLLRDGEARVRVALAS